jgi:uncharacterized phage protein gp47/JayE
MAITLRSFSTVVANSAAAAQGACATLLDLSVGSVLRAILEANAGIALWLQYVVLVILARTRLATSQGADVDSFVADFGLTRLAATYATGAVTLTSLNPSSQAATVPIGATVRTSDASVTYAVILDTTNAAYSASAGGYVRPQGQASISVPVQATVAGSSANVSAGAINVLGTAISGIDTVNNPLAFTNALDTETDAALQARFITFINSRSLATVLAIQNAVASVQTGILYQVVSNSDAAGNFLPGNVLIVVDDGTGNPPASLIAAVYAAVDAVRADTVSIQVIGPTIERANVAMTIAVSGSASLSATEAAIGAAITAYIDSLAVGATMSYSRLIQIAYATSPAVSNVTGITLNGGTSDLTAATGVAIRPGTIAIGP